MQDAARRNPTLAGTVHRDPVGQRPSLTMFFPCYNDAGTIGSMVAAADEVGREATADDYEIIVIDDGSTDRSRELLRALAKQYPRLRLVFHEQNRGYGGALRSGFQAATKDLVFYTDGDAQYDVFELRKLLTAVQEGVDVVNGYKIRRSDPWYRGVIGTIYADLMRTLFRFRVRDVDCDFRVIRRSALERVELYHASGVICVELVKKLELAGAQFVDFPVHHYYRAHGRSQFFNFPRLFRTGLGILRLWWHLVVLGRGPRAVVPGGRPPPATAP